MKSELVPINGDPPIPVTRDVTVIGRREYCDVMVADPSLSKRHCVLVRTDGLLMIRDLASTNGTKVNGQKVMWAALLPNDRVQLGKRKYKVYLGPDDAPSPSEQRGRMYSKSAVAAATPVPSIAALPAWGDRRADSTPSGFATPTPLGVPVMTPARPGSTDSDEFEELDDSDVLPDEDEPEFVIELD